MIDKNTQNAKKTNQQIVLSGKNISIAFWKLKMYKLKRDAHFIQASYWKSHHIVAYIIITYT